jgi:hypothetical protein
LHTWQVLVEVQAAQLARQDTQLPELITLGVGQDRQLLLAAPLQDLQAGSQAAQTGGVAPLL